MTIRAKLYTAIVVAVAGLAITVGVAAWAMNELGNRFDDVQRAADARALALRLKFDVTDFNGWQTAYGYDDGKSRPIYVAAFRRFEQDLAAAREELDSAQETAVLERIADAADDFDRLDAVAWAALQAGRTDQVRRIFLGPEIVNFQRAAAAAQQLAELEDANATVQDREFEDARDDALRVLVGAGIVSALLIVILLVTAIDLARQAEGKLEQDGS
jgi:methyl-accepting chemotaxis protein